ncbi:MAG: GreA/GreB family elongation factor [Patescibacteria group bacterium]|jgi:transcription elongation factor GreA
MRVPIRKGGQYTNIKSDPFMTEDKLAELEKNLDRLKKDVQPKLIAEVKRLALMGDFSENAAYQMAKGSLRGVNQKILNIEKQIANAQIIEVNKNKQTVQIGHLITTKIDDQKRQYRILGSSETNPSAGVISHHSPLGLALLGKAIGDIVEIKLGDKLAKYEIIKIE